MTEQAMNKQEHNPLRLVAQVVDQLAQEQPGKTYASFPLAPFSHELRRVTFAELARSVDVAARWIKARLDYPQTLAYLGAGDIRNYMLMLKLFLPSPRANIEANVHLLGAVECRAVLFASASAERAFLLADLMKLPVLEVPSLDALLGASLVQPLPLGGNFDQLKADAFAVFHTSGSTGLPKPVKITHGAVAEIDMAGHSPATNEGEAVLSRFTHTGRTLMGFPFFHAAGLLWLTAYPPFFGCELVLPSPGQPLSATSVSSLITEFHVETAILPPSIVEDMAGKEETLTQLTALRWIVHGGAPLSTRVGDLIASRGGHLWASYGSTEFPVFDTLALDAEDWAYLGFGKDAGVEFEPAGGDSGAEAENEALYELCIVRSGRSRPHGLFYNDPNLDRYRTGDLFTRHPDPIKCRLWRWRARADDLLVLANGEKVVPRSVEEAVMECPGVRTAIVLGQGRFQPCLIVERDGDKQVDIWPYVQARNSVSPQYASIARNFILFTSQDKSLPRSNKGAVIRSAAEKEFVSELDQLYDSSGKETEVAGILDANTIRQITRRVIHERIGPLAEDEDFFHCGLDSLRVREAVGALSDAGVGTTAESIYANPTLRALTAHLTGVQSASDRVQAMRNMLVSYTDQLSQPSPSLRYRVAIITGTTRGLGSSLVTRLAFSFDKIYCLNRESSSPRGQFPGLPLCEDLTVDLTQLDLGLSLEKYAELQRNATHLIHNAWQVDFNLSLESFRPHLDGVKNLIRLCAGSLGTKFVFLSTIAAANHTQDRVMERVSSPSKVHLDQETFKARALGYAESKAVAEALLLRSSHTMKLPVTVLRLGQIAGPTTCSGHHTERWNPRDWLPRLIASSARMGCIPETIPGMNVDWIPINKIAEVIGELSLNNDLADSGEILHVVSPSRTTWQDLLPTIRGCMETEIKTIPFPQWLESLEEDAATTGGDLEGKQDSAGMQTHTGAEANDRPLATPLLQFFRKLTTDMAAAELDNTQACAHSLTLCSLGPVKVEWMQLWMRQWGYGIGGSEEVTSKDEVQI